MRIIFFGTGTFAVPALRALADSIVLVVAQPDRPHGRKMELQPTPVKSAALELGLPIETPIKARAPEFIEVLKAQNADFLLVASYGQILSEAALNSARQGGINLHGSLLPKYRGAAPIQRSIENLETETGITLMQMDKGMDTGDMIAKVSTPIGPDETYGELQDRLSLIAAEMIVDWAPKLLQGNYPREVQNSELATTAPKVTREETEILFTEVAERAYGRYRAFAPGPGSFIQTSVGRIKLSSVRLGQDRGEPGTILAVSPNVTVAFQNGSLELHEVQPEGKKRMHARDWANGARLRSGSSLVPT